MRLKQKDTNTLKPSLDASPASNHARIEAVIRWLKKTVVFYGIAVAFIFFLMAIALVSLPSTSYRPVADVLGVCVLGIFVLIVLSVILWVFEENLKIL